MANLKNKRNKQERGAKIHKNRVPPEQITKSKQLMRKKSTPKKPAPKSTNRNPVPNTNDICLLPSLADLEKLFEESESVNTCETTPTCHDNTTSGNSEDVLNSVESAPRAGVTSNEIECKSKENQIITIPCEETLVPFKIKLDCSEKICIDCEPDYSSDDSCIEIPKKKRKIIEEEHTKSCDDNSATKLQVQTSNDSDTTVEYDIDILTPGRFSPLPSTSRDSDTILKNDLRFNASLVSHESPKKSIQSPKIIEAPKENLLFDSDLLVIEPPIETIEIDDEDDYPMICNSDQIYKERLPSPIVIDDEYSSMPINEEAPINTSDINIDDIIAENTSILQKYSDKIPLTVTEVPPVENKNQINPEHHNNSSPNITEAICKPGNCETTNLPALEIQSQQSNHNNVVNEPRIVDEPVVISDTEIQFNNPSDTMLGSIVNILHRVLHQNVNLSNRLHQTRNNLPSNRRKRKASTRTENCSSTQSMENNNLSTRSEISNLSTTTLANSNINTGRSKNDPMTPTTTPTPVKYIGDCPICLDSLATKTICSTICGHIFCMECIKRAARTSKKCPTCRKILKNNGYHQIYF